MDVTGNNETATGDSFLRIDNYSGTTTAFFNTWNLPERVSVHEVGDTIEMTYIETSMIVLAVYPPRPPEKRVFKIVYSCIEGKWNKSDRIYGEIIPAQYEVYKFK